jgi:hypothetical protein
MIVTGDYMIMDNSYKFINALIKIGSSLNSCKSYFPLRKLISEYIDAYCDAIINDNNVDFNLKLGIQSLLKGNLKDNISTYIDNELTNKKLIATFNYGIFNAIQSIIRVEPFYLHGNLNQIRDVRNLNFNIQGKTVRIQYNNNLEINYVKINDQGYADTDVKFYLNCKLIYNNKTNTYLCSPNHVKKIKKKKKKKKENCSNCNSGCLSMCGTIKCKTESCSVKKCCREKCNTFVPINNKLSCSKKKCRKCKKTKCNIQVTSRKTIKAMLESVPDNFVYAAIVDGDNIDVYISENEYSCRHLDWSDVGSIKTIQIISSSSRIEVNGNNWIKLPTVVNNSNVEIDGDNTPLYIVSNNILAVGNKFMSELETYLDIQDDIYEVESDEIDDVVVGIRHIDLLPKKRICIGAGQIVNKVS